MELVTFARPLTLRRHLYEIGRGQRKKNNKKKKNKTIRLTWISTA